MAEYYWSYSACTQTCPAGTFPEQGRCLACSAPCDSCLSLEICSTCVSPYVLEQGSCK